MLCLLFFPLDLLEGYLHIHLGQYLGAHLKSQLSHGNFKPFVHTVGVGDILCPAVELFK